MVHSTKILFTANNHLYEDSVAGCYFGGPLTFQAQALPDSSYLQAKQILDIFPPYLLNYPTKSFGCPDCADGGTLYLNATYRGARFSWKFDPGGAGVPPEIKGNMETITSVFWRLYR